MRKRHAQVPACRLQGRPPPAARLHGNGRKGRAEASGKAEMTQRLARSRAGAMSAGGGAQRDAGAAGG